MNVEFRMAYAENVNRSCDTFSLPRCVSDILFVGGLDIPLETPTLLSRLCMHDW